MVVDVVGVVVVVLAAVVVVVVAVVQQFSSAFPTRVLLQQIPRSRHASNMQAEGRFRNVEPNDDIQLK